MLSRANILHDTPDEVHEIGMPAGPAILAMDGRLRTLARAHQRLNRVIGRGLASLRSRDAFIRLGYANLESYVRQVLGIGTRHAQELAWMEERLHQRPLLDAVYEAGNVTYAAMRLILRRTRAESDVAFAQVAPRLTVHEVEAAIDDFDRMMAAYDGQPNAQLPGDVTPEGGSCGEGTEGGRWIDFVANPALAARWYTGLELARRLSGADLPAGACFELWAAEFLNGEGADAFEKAQNLSAQEAATAPWYKQWRQLNRVFWGEVERDIAELNDHWDFLSWDVPTVELPADIEADEALHGVFELDNRLRRAARLTHRVYNHLQRGLLEFARAREYLQIDFVSIEHYAVERLGMSASTARAMLKLERGLERHDAVRAAVRKGELTPTQAQLILRVVDETSARRWIAHARQTTVRFLKEDVEFAERLREQDPDAFGRTHGLRASSPVAVPEGAQRLEGTEIRQELPADADESANVRVKGKGRAQTCASGKIASFRQELQNIMVELRGEEDRYDVSGRNIGLRFWLPAEFESLWQDVRATANVYLGTVASPALCLEVCLDAFLATHGEEALACIRRHRILERDGFKCAVPTCGRRATLHVHHIEYRSRGGTNAKDGLITLCAVHHLHGEHGGSIHVSGRVPRELTWHLGIQPDGEPLLTVVGRSIRPVGCGEWHIFHAEIVGR